MISLANYTAAPVRAPARPHPPRVARGAKTFAELPINRSRVNRNYLVSF